MILRDIAHHVRSPHYANVTISATSPRSSPDTLILWPLSGKFPELARTKFVLWLLRSDLETWKYLRSELPLFQICTSSATRRKWNRQDRPGQYGRNRSSRVYFRRDCSDRIIPGRRINKSEVWRQDARTYASIAISRTVLISCFHFWLSFRIAVYMLSLCRVY